MNENCCYDREYEHWTDDCGGRYCDLRKISWCEWFNEDACTDCPFVCYYDDDNYVGKEAEEA